MNILRKLIQRILGQVTLKGKNQLMKDLLSKTPLRKTPSKGE